MAFINSTVPKFFSEVASKRIVKWFFTVSFGLSIDLVIFFLLSSFFLIPIFFVNILSSGIAITFVYFSSLKYVFTNKHFTSLRYTVFITYYSISISFFSYLITVLIYEFSLLPLFAKLITLPLSFASNYYFASKII